MEAVKISVWTRFKIKSKKLFSKIAKLLTYLEMIAFMFFIYAIIILFGGRHNIWTALASIGIYFIFYEVVAQLRYIVHK